MAFTSLGVRIIFYFYYKAPVLLTLSFPTRRSSDLAHRGLDAVGRCGGDQREDGAGLRALHLGRELLGLRVAAGAHQGDRKSTRLNSSHSQISYAVICLKKKICRSLSYS